MINKNYKEPNYKFKTVYKIFELSDDGLLKKVTRYNETIFNYYSGYESQEEAFEVIKKEDCGISNLIILPVVKKEYIYD